MSFALVEWVIWLARVDRDCGSEVGDKTTRAPWVLAAESLFVEQVGGRMRVVAMGLMRVREAR